jgi:tagaturonate epimerase
MTQVYESSVIRREGSLYALERDPASGEKWLVVQGDQTGFAGTPHGDTLHCPLTPENAAALRARLPWLSPAPFGLRTSAGFGDRLGQATPGHVQAAVGTGIAPIFAQQSVRENARTGRSPQQVVDDAMWGIFQAGWHEAWGADADHLKTPDVIAPFVAAGYSFFTVDPGDHVDNDAHIDPLPMLREKTGALPWPELDSSLADLEARYLGKTFDLGGEEIVFDETALFRAAAKYGRALAHIRAMYGELKAQLGSAPFDFEVSVDETDTPTATHEHFFLATEMRRLGIEWVSLAPRFVGRFEKGVDYIGDLGALDRCLAEHAAVMRHFGGYKLSLHSGSDKFTVYPMATHHAGGLVHLKTAGTSYLEALRAWAVVDPAGFREILDFSRQRYETDRATYHVSAQLAKVPAARELTNAALPDLLNQFDARQVLHVTYGSVLDHYGERLHALLRAHEDQYYTLLRQHFARHLEPFTV